MRSLLTYLCPEAILYIEFIRDFLKEVGTDLNAISNYLLGDLAAMSGWHKSRIRARDDCLPEDFDFEDAKIALARKKITPVSVKELEKAERVCIVFQEVTDVSLWEVSKRSEESVKSSLAPARLSGGNPGEGMSSSAAGAIAALSGGNPAPYSLESYAALNCLYCYMLDTFLIFTMQKELQLT